MIPLTKHTFYKEAETKKALTDFITGATQLSMGPKSAEFEEAFAKWQGRAYSVFFNSGSSANLALIQALVNLGRLQSGDKVAYSAVTWATNVMPLIQCGLIPVPVDIEKETLNISLAQVKAAYDANPFTCLFITNLLGFCSDIDAIAAFCDENNILFIEDNCEALGSVYRSKKLGNWGQASTFSFFVGHHMSTIEGGMVATDDPELAAMLKMVRSHGWTRNISAEEQAVLREKHGVTDFYDRYTFYDLAYNLRPTDIQGFVGLTQLPYLNEMIEKRIQNYARLSAVYSNPDFIPMNISMDVCSNFAFPVLCKTKELQEKYIERCKAAGIEHRPIVGGSMPKQPFHKKYVSGSYDLPGAEYVHDIGFYVGNNADMTEEDINTIIKALS